MRTSEPHEKNLGMIWARCCSDRIVGPREAAHAASGFTHPSSDLRMLNKAPPSRKQHEGKAAACFAAKLGLEPGDYIRVIRSVIVDAHNMSKPERSA